MLKIEFKLNSRNPIPQWQKLQTVFRTFEPELKIIGRDLVKYFRDDVFETEGAIHGSAWQDIKAETKRRKAQLYAGRATRILEASGKMRKSYRLFTTAQYAIIKNTQYYAKYHQEGTDVLPQRILVKTDANKNRLISETFRKHIQERIARALA